MTEPGRRSGATTRVVTTPADTFHPTTSRQSPPQAGLASSSDRARYPLLDADGAPWWDAYFGEDYGLLYPDKDEASGEQEVRAILAAIAIRSGARVLDVGCGPGRHSMALARRGYQVTALDVSPTLLAQAAASRDAAGLDIDLRLADMRNLPLPGAPLYDALLSVFTSFGYLSDPENEAVARGMAAALAPGGRLLLDLNNSSLLEKAHGQRTWSERPGGFLLDEFAYDAEARRFFGHRILLTDGRERRYPFDHRVYTEAEIRGLLKRSGLRVLAVYGSLDRTPFNDRASRMVVLAEKP